MSFKSIQARQIKRRAEIKSLAEIQGKKLRLVIYWAFSTTLIVFAAVTTYITLWLRPLGASMLDIITAGFPIWGLTALAATILVGGYYLTYARHTL